jgi:hypothetical protein
MRMMSKNFSKCPKGLSQNLTIGLNLKFPAKTLCAAGHLLRLNKKNHRTKVGDTPLLQYRGLPDFLVI